VNKSQALHQLVLPEMQRHALAEALKTEAPLKLDSRLIATESGRTAVVKAGAKYITKQGGFGVLAYNFGGPLAVAALAAAAAITGEQNAVTYEDYSLDANDKSLATNFLLHSPTSLFAELNMTVAGSLSRFLRESIIEPFTTRVSALSEVAANDPTDALASSRLQLYTTALGEAREIEVHLATTLAQRETERRNAVQAEVSEMEGRKQQIDQQLASIETKHAAGLLSYEEYSKTKRSLSRERMGLSIGGGIIKAVEYTKFDVAEQNPRDLLSFYQKLCSRVPLGNHEPAPVRAQESAEKMAASSPQSFAPSRSGTKTAAVMTVIAVAAAIFYFALS
jgi:hypothetical protein